MQPEIRCLKECRGGQRSSSNLCGTMLMFTLNKQVGTATKSRNSELSVSNSRGKRQGGFNKVGSCLTHVKSFGGFSSTPFIHMLACWCNFPGFPEDVWWGSFAKRPLKQLPLTKDEQEQGREQQLSFPCESCSSGDLGLCYYWVLQ